MNASSDSTNEHQPVEDFSQCHVGILRKLDMLNELPALLGPAARAREIAASALEFFREAIFEHHERLDGSGYPLGLKGDEIGYAGRILAVADVCDAMTSHRPYRPARSQGELVAELKRCRGIHYDARVVDAAPPPKPTSTPAAPVRMRCRAAV